MRAIRPGFSVSFHSYNLLLQANKTDNLRYAFDYCIFGYPNATGIGSNPCLTPEACGKLGTALKDGITTPEKVQRLQYCDIDGGVLTGSYYESCLQCVQADGQHAYLSNCKLHPKIPKHNLILAVLIALEAGCKQKPPAHIPIGLNETIFTSHTIQIVEPSAQSPPSPTLVLSTPAIAGIAIGSVVFLALLSGCTYMQIRKRRNKLDRSRRTLSFRCKTAAATSQPVYTDDYDDERFFEKAEPEVSAVSMSPVARSKPVPWEAHGRQLNISTSVPCPEAAYTSPRMGGFSPDDFTPPTSTVSTRSSAPLLRGGFPSPGMGGGVFGRPSAVVSQDARMRSETVDGRKGTPGSPVRITRIQTTFDPPPTK